MGLINDIPPGITIEFAPPKNHIRLAENLPWCNISMVSSAADVRGNGIAKAKSLGGDNRAIPLRSEHELISLRGLPKPEVAHRVQSLGGGE